MGCNLDFNPQVFWLHQVTFIMKKKKKNNFDFIHTYIWPNQDLQLVLSAIKVHYPILQK